MMEPFAEDEVVRIAAERIGCPDVQRHQVIEISDEAALRKHPEYWRRAIDWTAVRRSLRNGVEVPGVRATGEWEYVLRRNRNTSSAVD